MATIQAMPEGQERTLLDPMLAQGARSLEEVGRLVPPRKVCVENIESFPFHEVLPLVEERGMRICLDVGHLVVDGGDPLEFLTDRRDLIGEIHLHDALRGRSGGSGAQAHLALGRGEIDYAGFMSMLADGGFGGVLILEVNTEVDLRESMERVRPWL